MRATPRAWLAILLVAPVLSCAPEEAVLSGLPPLIALLPTSVPLEVTAGSAWTAPTVVIMKQDLTIRTDFEDTVTAEVFSDAECSSAAAGTWTVTPQALASGTASLSGLVYTPTGATDETVYIKFKTVENDLSACHDIPVAVIQPFVAGSGFATWSASTAQNAVFTGTGTSRVEIPSQTAPVTDASGRVVVAFSTKRDDGGYGLTVVRYQTNGTLDATFGTQGVYQYQVAGNGAAGASGAAKRDLPSQVIAANGGGYYVVGTSKSGGGSTGLAVWKLTDAGALDTGFDTDGIFTATLATQLLVRHAVLDPENKLLIVGRKNADLALWKLDPAALADAPVITPNVSADFDSAEGVRILTTGSGADYRIWIFGNVGDQVAGVWSAGTVFISKWTDPGTPALDATFHAGAAVIYDAAVAAGIQTTAGGARDELWDVARDSSGDFLLAGSVINAAGGQEATVWKFGDDGVVDSTYGAAGVARFQPDDYGAARATNASKLDVPRAAWLDSAGVLWMAGSSKNGFGGTVPVSWKVDATGTAVTAWGGSTAPGALLLKYGEAGYGGATNANKTDAIFGAVLDARGRLLLVGRTKTAAGAEPLWVARMKVSTGLLD